MPSWIELAAAAAVLLLVLLIVLILLTLRATNRRRARRQAGKYGIAETHDIFVADKTRITHRPAPLPEAAKAPEPPSEPAQ
ncbi:MAG TPA: hypothetical protein VGF38_18145 [Ktedonobacterales bacterium]|jgi:hypothetical protein